ncbi:MAG: M3 family metallopeptidase [Bacteroidaceae bacterium]|nr:M3 family metallopeptidase [Bacteroidaceae bacterium]
MKTFDFSKPYNTIHQVTPFNLIQVSDYEPGIMQGIKEEEEEINNIVNNPEFPTFENTIEALEKTGETLHRVTNVFFNLLSCETNDEMEEIANKVQPALTEHSNNIGLNEKLFERIKKVYDSHPSLNNEQQKLLDETYKSFIRRGANLSPEKKEIFRKISLELSQNSLQFSQNSLKETNSYILHVKDKSRLKGLPENSLEAAAQTAKEKNLEGWVFTLQAPSYGPFMSFCEDRELRKELYLAYNTKCAHGGNTDNQDLVKKLVNGRIQLAQLLGYSDFASYVLENRMAENKDNVFNLLHELLEKYRPVAEKEVKAIEELAHETEGADFKLMPWDFAFYSDKLKLKLFNINKEILRPYFQVDKVIEGVFALATKLYGITFKENREIPVFNPDVIPFEVFDKDGSFLAVLYTDFYPREGKRSGAWMTSYKEQWIEKDGTNSRPHVSITANLTKPTPTKPALLTLDEVQTFLHEFGHALHGIFANTTYESLSGTNVYWDFVELPSQFMENYANEKEFLNTFAYHYQTGEALPVELIQRINDSRNFNVAYACLRQISFGLLDMAYYTRKELLPESTDIKNFEHKAWESTQLLPVIPECCMSTQFSHIMTGGYAAGYYSYKWAEVLDADAFEYFQETGIFNQETANKFRNMLSKGGTIPPMKLYEEFRGKAPSIHALLHRNGII